MLSSGREEGALEEPDEDQFDHDDAHRDDHNSLLCDGSLDDRYRLCNVTTNSLLVVSRLVMF